jgi:hypothetical protein
MAIARHGMAQHYRLRPGGGLSLLTSAVAVLILGAAAQSRADTITVTGGSAGFDEGDPPGFHLILDEGELSGGFFLGGMILNFPVNSAINCYPRRVSRGTPSALPPNGQCRRSTRRRGGFGALADAAVAAVSEFRADPPRVNGAPLLQVSMIAVTFQP